MSHSTNAMKNKNQKHPKVGFNQYLYNAGEPSDDASHDLPPELEVELLENSHSMKRRFRHNAQVLRNHYS